MFGIGIGKDINIKELESVASAPENEHVFTVSSFTTLATIVSVLSSKTCEGKSCKNSRQTGQLVNILQTSLFSVSVRKNLISVYS